jgi:bis(5'-nucleosidyl)-tetraphosphatase
MRRQQGRWRCLLLRSYRNWDFPKGIVEPGEEPLQAALREVNEETGLRELTLPWGDAWRETEPYAGGKVARYYVAESAEGTVTLPVNLELGRAEHHEFRWLEPDAAARLLPARLLPVLRWAQGVAEGAPTPAT